MPDTKLIFLDIDGTLVRAGENTPPDSALKAIRAADTETLAAVPGMNRAAAEAVRAWAEK